MRDIRRYISDMSLDAKLRPAQFFIESNYKDLDMLLGCIKTTARKVE